MQFDDVVRRRRMVRNFEDRPVSADVLERILANALRAPSAGFSQGWAFVVLEGDDTARFWDALGRDPTSHLRRAPVVIVPLAHKQAYLDRYAAPDKAGTGLDAEGAWPVPYWQIDTAFATMLILLGATDAGLGALFFGIFRNEDVVLDALDVPAGYRPIGAIALGYAAPDRPSPSLARGRHSLEDVVHRGGW